MLIFIRLKLKPGHGGRDQPRKREIMTTRPAPNPEQLAALAAFAKRHGRTWRADLADAWSTGRDTAEPGGYFLRQVRNTWGPAWIATVAMAELAATRCAA
jgi:hypothetical protein